MKIFIASSQTHAGKIKEDILIRDKLISLGESSEIIPYGDLPDTANPSDVVLLKSIWGYHEDYQRLIQIVNNLRSRSVKLLNDPRFIHWNINKYQYMSDLKQAGVGVIETRLLNTQVEDASNLYNSLAYWGKYYGEDRIVVKPAISASGFNTHLIDLANPDPSQLSMLLNQFATHSVDYIVQPFIEEITAGELSLVAIDGQIMYGIQRFPGILSTKEQPIFVPLDNVSPEAMNIGQFILNYMGNRFDLEPALARIDFAANRYGHQLMELELIDPDLYFRNLPEVELEQVLGKVSQRLQAEASKEEASSAVRFYPFASIHSEEVIKSISELSQVYNVSQTILKRVLGAPIDIQGFDANKLLSILRHVEIHRIPFYSRNPDEFMSMVSTIKLCLAVSRSILPSGTEEQIESLAAKFINNTSAKKTWKSAFMRAADMFRGYEQYSPVDDKFETPVIQTWSADMVKQFTESVILPLAHAMQIIDLSVMTMEELQDRSSNVYFEILSLVMNGLIPEEFLKSGFRWYEKNPQIIKPNPEKVRQLDLVTHWNSLPSIEVDSEKKAEVVALQSLEELKSEAILVENCTNLYLSRCITEQSIMLSVRVNGVPQSTAEAKFSTNAQGQPMLYVLQHKGIQNVRIPNGDDVDQFLQTYVKTINGMLVAGLIMPDKIKEENETSYRQIGDSLSATDYIQTTNGEFSLEDTYEEQREKLTRYMRNFISQTKIRVGEEHIQSLINLIVSNLAFIISR